MTTLLRRAGCALLLLIALAAAYVGAAALIVLTVLGAGYAAGWGWQQATTRHQNPDTEPDEPWGTP